MRNEIGDPDHIPPTGTSHIYVESDMASPCALPFLGGVVAAYAHRCPEKQTPNEDSLAVIPVSDRSGILVVADGVGGSRAGQQASGMAVFALQEALAEVSNDRTYLRSAILDGIERANAAILELGLGAATTLSVVEVNGNEIRPYHVGDSMILLVGSHGKVKLQTIPHSPVGLALEAGFIDESEAMHHDDRHVISNSVGSEEMRIEIGSSIRMAARDTLLIASDGLADNLTAREIIDVIRCGNLMARLTSLLKTAERRMSPAGDQITTPSKPDDISVVAFRRGPSANQS